MTLLSTKNKITSLVYVLLSLFVFLGIHTSKTFAQQESVVLTSGTSWTIPADADPSSITVECWGGGGGGAYTTSSSSAGGGGGGGAYAKKVFTSFVTGQTINYVIGNGGSGASGTNNGGDTWFFNNSTLGIKAAGGRGAANNASEGGLGGAATASFGDITFSGGKGGNGSYSSGFWCGDERASGGGGAAASPLTTGIAGGNASTETGNFLCDGNHSTPGTGGSNELFSGYTSKGGNGVTYYGSGVAGSYGAGGSGGVSGTYNGGNGGNGLIRITYNKLYHATYLSMNIGSTTWCAGETRSVSVTIKNTGTLPWTDGGGEDFNIGVKWNGEPDYLVRVDAQNLAPGATQTFNLSVTAPNTTGSQNLTFNVVREGVSWFGGEYTSVGVDIKDVPDVDAGADVEICSGESVQLEGSVISISTCLSIGSGSIQNSCIGEYNYNSANNNDHIVNFSTSGGSTNISNINSGFSTGSYGDFTSQLVTALAGGSFNISVYAGDNWNHGFRIWVDWNNNGVFEASESVWSGGTGKVVFSGVINVPADQVTGRYRMRVRCLYNAIPSATDACTTLSYGEIEDYTLQVNREEECPKIYSWSGDPIISGANTLTPTVDPTITTTYTLTTTVDGCSASDDVQVIVTNPSGAPSVFGDFVWNVYGYSGYDTDLSANDYRGYYIQPDLGSGNFGVNTQSFWSDTRSPSYAGTTIDNGNLWNGCSVDDDYHTFTHKRKGFPCGNYTFTMNAWDDETRVIIDGVNIWSCDTWSGGTGANSNGSIHGCETTNIFTVQLDADSEVEFHTFERTGGARLSVDIVKSAPVALVGSASATRTCRVRGNNWIDFYDENDELIASINPNGNDLGDVTMTSFVGSPMVMQDCDWPSNALYHTAYMGRRWIMTSDAYPNGIDFNNDVSVRLPYRVSELADLNNHAQTATPDNPFDGGTTDPAATRSNLMLTKITGTTEDGVANLADCASTILGIPNSGSGVAIQSIANTEYVDFSIAQFSEFFLHKNHITSPLPVTLTSLSATCDNKVTLNWTTESEQNSDRFVVEKSRDGVTWEFVGEQTAAGNSNAIKNYSQTDHTTWNGVSYYRLRQIDYDGKEEIYGPISVSCDGKGNNITVYPNPNDGDFIVEITTDKAISDAELQLFELTGKIVSSQHLQIPEGITQVSIDKKAYLKPGTYVLKVIADVYFEPVKIVVK